LWYFLLEHVPSQKRHASDTYNIKAMSQNCPLENQTGPYCNLTINNANPSAIVVVPLPAGSWTYYRFQASYPGNPFWVSVATDQPFIPEVYVSLNNIPTRQSYDTKYCNQPYCNYASIINLSNSSFQGNQTFYVGVFSQNTTSFGMWFGSICAPGCDIHGSCTVSGPQTGLCSCPTDGSWKGYDCLTDTTVVDIGMPVQFIVLIFFASLVVAIDIIGFIARA